MRFMVLGFLALAACSSAPVEGTLDAGAGNVGDAATKKVCGPPPGGAPSENARCVRDVAGVITDDRGSPVRDLTITVCGVVCFAALSDGAGAFRVPVDAHLPEGGYAMTANGRPTLGGTCDCQRRSCSLGSRARPRDSRTTARRGSCAAAR